MIPRRRSSIQPQRDRWLPALSVLLLVAIFVAWHLAVRLFDISRLVLPPPADVLDKLWGGLRSGMFFRHAKSTSIGMGLGFLLGLVSGVAVGVTLARFPRFGRVVQPFIVSMQSFPKIALAPLFAVIFGYGMTPKVVIAWILAFFPVMVSTVAGFRATDSDERSLLATLNATGWQEFRYVRLPNALPFLFAAIEVAVVLALLGTITAEFVGASSGLGYLLVIKISLLEVDSVYALLLFFAVIGSVLFIIIRALRRRIVFWQRED